MCYSILSVGYLLVTIAGEPHAWLGGAAACTCGARWQHGGGGRGAVLHILLPGTCARAAPPPLPLATPHPTPTHTPQGTGRSATR